MRLVLILLCFVSMITTASAKLSKVDIESRDIILNGKNFRDHSDGHARTRATFDVGSAATLPIVAAFRKVRLSRVIMFPIIIKFHQLLPTF